MHQHFHFQREGFQEGADLGGLAGTRRLSRAPWPLADVPGPAPCESGGRSTCSGESEAFQRGGGLMHTDASPCFSLHGPRDALPLAHRALPSEAETLPRGEVCL